MTLTWLCDPVVFKISKRNCQWNWFEGQIGPFKIYHHDILTLYQDHTSH